MTKTIVFDTNYLKSLSLNDYLAGKIPEKLKAQIELAVSRGDLVALVDTVRTETNAWLEVSHKRKQQENENSIQRLLAEGYKVTPDTVPNSPSPDILDILHLASDKCTTLSPTIEDYKEAERRTSYRLPPLPKNPDGEEMRDRLIWCQILRWSNESGKPVLIVSGDTIFKNGASSDEGINARIKVVEGEVDFDQQLGERPAHIEKLIESILTFAPELEGRGINLTNKSIVGIEELRKVHEKDGSITQRFFLLTSSVDNLDERCIAAINCIGDEPHTINIATTPPISLAKEITEPRKGNFDLLNSLNSQNQAINELRNLLRI